jgi:hypothetical protein
MSGDRNFGTGDKTRRFGNREFDAIARAFKNGMESVDAAKALKCSTRSINKYYAILRSGLPLYEPADEADVLKLFESCRQLEVSEIFATIGGNRNTLGSFLRNLESAGKIRRIAWGVYRLVEAKGPAAPAPVKVTTSSFIKGPTQAQLMGQR